MKLSTEKLRELMASWLSTDELKDQMCGYYTSHLEGYDSEYMKMLIESIGCKKKNPTVKDLDDKIWADWSNPDQWKRVEKYKLKDSWSDYIYNDGGNDGKPYFAEDFAGGSDQSLLEYYTANEAEAEKLINRVFVPKNDRLSDNFRMEVVTTPDDSKVVGWTIIVD